MLLSDFVSVLRCFCFLVIGFLFLVFNEVGYGCAVSKGPMSPIVDNFEGVVLIDVALAV